MKRAGEAGIVLRASGVKTISDWLSAARHGDLSQHPNIHVDLEYNAMATLSGAYSGQLFGLHL
jgi:hypothetical protein